MSEPQGLGRFEGKVHILPIRIYYEDTDLSGVVYHANYLRYMERGRTEFFRCAGVWLARLDDAEPIAWTLRKVMLEFHRPARLEDPLEVRTTFSAMSGARMEARQDIVSNGVLLLEGRVEACLITLSGRPRRIPPEVRDRLRPFLSETNA